MLIHTCALQHSEFSMSQNQTAAQNKAAAQNQTAAKQAHRPAFLTQGRLKAHAMFVAPTPTTTCPHAAALTLYGQLSDERLSPTGRHQAASTVLIVIINSDQKHASWC